MIVVDLHNVEVVGVRDYGSWSVIRLRSGDATASIFVDDVDEFVEALRSAPRLREVRS